MDETAPRRPRAKRKKKKKSGKHTALQAAAAAATTTPTSPPPADPPAESPGGCCEGPPSPPRVSPPRDRGAAPPTTATPEAVTPPGVLCSGDHLRSSSPSKSPSRRATIAADVLVSPEAVTTALCTFESIAQEDGSCDLGDDLAVSKSDPSTEDLRRFSRGSASEGSVNPEDVAQGSLRRIHSACAAEYASMSCASSEDSAGGLHSRTYPQNCGLERFEYGEPESDNSLQRALQQNLHPRGADGIPLVTTQNNMTLRRAALQGRIKRSQSTGQLPERKTVRLFNTYSAGARALLRQRTNSHFLPSSLPLKAIEKQRKRVMFARFVGVVLQMLLSVAVVYTSFANISFITYWNPYVKVTQYAGRMLFPVLDATLGVTAADYSLWVGSQLGYYRALGRFSGTYRKLIEHTHVRQGDSAVEFLLNQLHWVLDFLYFPTEHLALVEWEAVVFGIKSKLFFARINAIVWYWRQVLMVCLLLHAIYHESLALEALATSIYMISVLADLLCAYNFLPLARRRYPTYTSWAQSWFYTRSFTIGLGLHGFLGVTEGLCQISLRWMYSKS